jgi:hypothetical protein
MKLGWVLEASNSALLGKPMSDLYMSETETAWLLKTHMSMMILWFIFQSITKVPIGEGKP